MNEVSSDKDWDSRGFFLRWDAGDESIASQARLKSSRRDASRIMRESGCCDAKMRLLSQSRTRRRGCRSAEDCVLSGAESS